MKRTTIDYVVILDGKVRIIDILNAEDYDCISKEFGKEVRRLYSNGFPRYRGGDEHVVCIPENYDSITIFEGDIVSKEKFSKVIDCMKQSGKRLADIVKAQKNYKVKRVTI